MRCVLAWAPICAASICIWTAPAGAKRTLPGTVDQVIAACAASGDSTTAAEAGCLARELRVEKSKLERSYDAFVGSDLRMVGGRYGSFDPRGEMTKAQRAWEQWMRAECSMRADLTRGSEAAIFLPACELNLTRQREKELARLARAPGTTF